MVTVAVNTSWQTCENNQSWPAAKG